MTNPQFDDSMASAVNVVHGTGRQWTDLSDRPEAVPAVKLEFVGRGHTTVVVVSEDTWNDVTADRVTAAQTRMVEDAIRAFQPIRPQSILFPDLVSRTDVLRMLESLIPTPASPKPAVDADDFECDEEKIVFGEHSHCVVRGEHYVHDWA